MGQKKQLKFYSDKVRLPLEDFEQKGHNLTFVLKRSLQLQWGEWTIGIRVETWKQVMSYHNKPVKDNGDLDQDGGSGRETDKVRSMLYFKSEANRLCLKIRYVVREREEVRIAPILGNA